ncbi:MAG TPA: glycogen/starch/alpha-glucan phosphorylase, partial [Clostridia bacterium]|nr:glycogen/starch/alpha-glucan phosphorylase [Clostridia bacterium]
GAITLGTLDGANVEIHQAVGGGNMAIFGMNADKVMRFYQQGGYHSWEEYHSFPRLKKVVDQLIDGFFGGNKGEFKIIYDSLLQHNDEFFVLKDFSSYMDAWHRLNMIYGHQVKWQKMSLVNIAKGGVFASDRTIREYAEEIWRVPYQN